MREPQMGDTGLEPVSLIPAGCGGRGSAPRIHAIAAPGDCDIRLGAGGIAFWFVIPDVAIAVYGFWGPAIRPFLKIFRITLPAIP